MSIAELLLHGLSEQMGKTFQLLLRRHRHNTIDQSIALLNGQPVVTNKIISSNQTDQRKDGSLSESLTSLQFVDSSR